MEAQVRRLCGASVRFEEKSLYSLMGAERGVAIDALASGREFPLVIMGDTLACSGDLDAGAIVAAVLGKSAPGPGTAGA